MDFATANATQENDMSALDRREFLKAAGVMMSLPLLESIPGVAHAQAAPIQRLVIVYTTQGLPYQYWRPIAQPGGGFDLNHIWHLPVDVDGQSVTLADFRDDLSIVTGVDVRSAIEERGNSHNLAAGHNLVGQAMGAGGANDNHTQSGGPSVDHIIARAIADPSVAMQSLHLGVRSPWEICYTGAAQPVDRLTRPDSVIQSLFGDFTNPDNQGLARLRQRRRSVLDATTDNISSLRRRLSHSDQSRLDEYLERVREIERRLNATSVRGESCRPLSPLSLQRSPHRDASSRPNFHPYYDPDVSTPAMIDVLVESLACDRTRVATLTVGDIDVWHWLRDRNGDVVTAATTGDWHQDVVHAYWLENRDGARNNSLLEDQLCRVARWEHSMFAYLLARLKGHREGDGTLLDNSMVVFVNEFGAGTHTHNDIPYIVAGRAGGVLQPGQWLQYDQEPHNRLLLSMMRTFGVDDPTFGDPALCGAGPLTELFA
jgi:hypothetical protein